MTYQIFPAAPFQSKRRTRSLLFDPAILIIVRRLVVPFLLFLAFVLAIVFLYMRLEKLAFSDALFWFTHSHAIEYAHVHTATKYVSILVAFGTFAFEIWF